ncbi:MAG TPA: hypothetical protein VGB72_04730 [Acidobacteriota bacterium]
MNRQVRIAFALLALVFLAGYSSAYAQAAFKIPFKFQAAGKSYPVGDYFVARKGESEITLCQEATGKEVQIPFTEKLAQPTTPLEEPQLVFDAVGNFEPSYTEYFTVYVLAEVWLPGEDGLRVHTTKGAHQTQVVKGQKAK